MERSDEIHPTSTARVPLGGLVLSGAALTLVISVAQKIIAMAGQLGIARFLRPADIGVFAVATSIVSLAPLLACGQKELLIRYQGDVKSGSSQTFWRTLLLLLLGVGAVGGAVHILKLPFPDPRLTKLVMLLLLSVPLHAPATVAIALLSRSLRFRALALINGLSSALSTTVAVGLSWKGVGPLALVLAATASNLTVALGALAFAGGIPRERPRPSEWPQTFRAGSWIILQNAFALGASQGPILILGVMAEPSMVGAYVWGVSVASQVAHLVGASLAPILFPVMVRLESDPDRRRAGMELSTQLLTCVAAPVGCAQAILAGPILRIFFHSEWGVALPVITWTSLALGFLPVQIVCGSTVLAAGHFRAAARLAFIQSMLVSLALVLGASCGSLACIAVLGSAAQVLFSAYSILVADQLGLVSCARLVGKVLPGASCALASYAGTILTAHFLPGLPPLFSPALSLGAFFVTYLGVLRLVSPASTALLQGRLREIVGTRG